MEQYSRRFIEELEKHIDPTIIEFFEKKRNLLKFPCNSMTELIDETLMNYLEGKTSREDLIPVINKIKKSRLQKRARWYKSYITDIETMTLDDPKHPVASIINMARSLPIDQYVNIFGDKELDEIIEEYNYLEKWCQQPADFVSWNCFFYKQFYLQLIKKWFND